jgi:hypothetical protein
MKEARKFKETSGLNYNTYSNSLIKYPTSEGLRVLGKELHDLGKRKYSNLIEF